MEHRSDKKYGLLILTIIIMITLLVSAGEWNQKRMMKEALESPNNPMSYPFAWYGIGCMSTVNLNMKNVPFNLKIFHPPTRTREGLTAALQKLPEQNSTLRDEPLPDAILEKYFVVKTECVNSWQHYYERINYFTKGAISELLPQGKTPTEAALREAILRQRFPKSFDAADEMFPLEAELIGPTDE